MRTTTYSSWGSDIDSEARAQMDAAIALPIAVAGALMPDAHVGYGLPIGGVLATENAVIPYGVGVDIACRMMMTIFDVPPQVVDTQRDFYIRAIEQNTRFGIGAEWKDRKSHAVMDADWSVTRTTAALKDRAHRQLGTSGSGNHFVEFVALSVESPALKLPSGSYLALLSHSGSRNVGAQVASYFTSVARSQHPDLQGNAKNLSWLDMDGDGAEYWAAMELMGAYASANHHLIHEAIARALGHPVMRQLENHHNFAWRERYGDRELIVHRKGATPAGNGVIGIIPGSMGTPGFIVEGAGNTRSMNSASHGAGRRMSRAEARRAFSWKATLDYLRKEGIHLISAGLDEAPWAYKNIDDVMSAQAELAHPIARFLPRLVKMAPSGERPED